MKPVRKQFDAHPDFPFDLTYRDTKTPQLELPDHMHEWYELVYVHRGKGAFFIDRTIEDMREGDLFIIPGSTIHRAFPDKDDPVTSTALFLGPLLVEQRSLGESFSYLQCFDQSRVSRNYRLACSPALRQAFEAGLQRIEAEYSSQPPGYRHAIQSETQLLLLAVHRERGGASKHRGASAFAGPLWMRDMLLYVDRHFTEEIGLGALCRQAAVSPAHFSRVFKQLTGMNVTKFVALKRIILAKELLLESTDSVSAIAARCGFESMPHFHRVFKRIVGVTPAAYRHPSPASR
ncbi:AraC family transcriptional regulator [Paenibacillus sacheonensis]|uniref:Helix-turn-helix domain-containing protein n=1 Tax=Paenibacillus sacheonensis TaxID=742054 RepID=A0A7X4YL50_9BACL|nr:AraC family transcriptional regulator [Paenibacillus sacheonensis]MBM7564007.1 AraC-like DNA-binding protein [Paenibacillus sacheonensis]NBC67656.1 helix-turn-helix domain-containing protein [Paenibacillus sacheonensis]